MTRRSLPRLWCYIGPMQQDAAFGDVEDVEDVEDDSNT